MKSVMAVSTIAVVQPIVPITKHRQVKAEERPMDQVSTICPRDNNTDPDWIAKWVYDKTCSSDCRRFRLCTRLHKENSDD
jgi:hypothetical protein